jgi:6-pyruvoyltetrahydropterin/6-carboxytetrahydropterin synthase
MSLAVRSRKGYAGAMRARIVQEFRFEAAHRLPRVPEGHKCARLHGHSYKVDVVVGGAVDMESGWICDFAVIEDAWKSLHDTLDHRYLNEIPGLDNPTSEILAGFIWERLAPTFPGLARVVVHETCESRCEYEGERE